MLQAKYIVQRSPSRQPPEQGPCLAIAAAWSQRGAPRRAAAVPTEQRSLCCSVVRRGCSCPVAKWRPAPGQLHRGAPHGPQGRRASWHKQYHEGRPLPSLLITSSFFFFFPISSLKGKQNRLLHSLFFLGCFLSKGSRGHATLQAFYSLLFAWQGSLLDVAHVCSRLCAELAGVQNSFLKPFLEKSYMG